VPNRYFGAFTDGSVKARGIDLRRRDAPPFVAQAQRDMLDCLARAESAADLPARVNQAVRILGRRMRELRAGSVPLEELLVGKRLSKELDGYRVPSPGARAVMQLQAAGKSARPGQRVRLLYTRSPEGVYAWNLPRPPEPAAVDWRYYQELLLRAGSALLQPFGLDEEALRVAVSLDLGAQLCLPLRAWKRQRPSRPDPILAPGPNKEQGAW